MYIIEYPTVHLKYKTAIKCWAFTLILVLNVELDSLSSYSISVFV